MSFTDRDIVRKHLLSSATPEQIVTALPITLTSVEDLQLPDSNLLVGSVTVKRLVTIAPERTVVNMSGSKDISLPYTHLVPGSVVVSITESLVQIYLEEVDYRIDYEEGTIVRMDSGSIPDGQQVNVFYEKYEVFEDIVDYIVDCTEGILRRTAGSSIPSGGSVLIDYTVEEGSLVDELIEQTVIEAEDLILRSLSPEYSSSSTDQGLETGATQLVLSIIARALAANALIEDRSSDASNRAAQWQKLCDLYEAKAWDALAPFLDPNQLHSPVVQ